MIGAPHETVDLRSRAASLSEGDQVLAAVLDQYLTALENGAPIAIEQLAGEHPALADDIRSFAASIELLHAAAIVGHHLAQFR